LLLGALAACPLLVTTPLLLLLLPLLPLSPLLLASAAGTLLLLSLLLGLATTLLVLPLLSVARPLLVSALAGRTLSLLVLLPLPSLLLLLLALLRLLSISSLLLGSLAGCALLLLLLLPLASLLHLLIRRLTSSGGRLLPWLALRAADRRARRIIAEAASLASPQRLRVGNVVTGLDHVAGFAHRRRAIKSPGPDIIGSDDVSARNLDRPCKHAWSNVIDRKRLSDSCRDICRRDTWVDRDPRTPALDHDRLVDDHGLANHHIHLVLRQDHCSNARRGEIAYANEDPHLRLLHVVDDDLFGRERRPADVSISRPVAPPAHESRAPFASGDPDPLHLLIKHPAAVVEGDDAPCRFFLVFDPVPTPVIGVSPVADRIWPPIPRTVGRAPHLAPA
jgi:hypothetical protein